MNVIVQTYCAAYFDGVDSLWREVFPDDPPWNHAHLAIPAKLAVQPELFLVAVEDDEHDTVVGTVMGGYDGHRGWVYALAVKRTFRHQGIATKLMAELERRLAAAGCGKLNLQVRAGNTQVIALYERLGYQVEDRVSLGKRLKPP